MRKILGIDSEKKKEEKKLKEREERVRLPEALQLLHFPIAIMDLSCILPFPGKTSKIGRTQEKLRQDCHGANWNCDHIPGGYGASKHI